MKCPPYKGEKLIEKPGVKVYSDGFTNNLAGACGPEEFVTFSPNDNVALSGKSNTAAVEENKKALAEQLQKGKEALKCYEKDDSQETCKEVCSDSKETCASYNIKKVCSTERTTCLDGVKQV